MNKSFSATDYKGVELKGTILFTSFDSTLCLVEEDLTPSLPPVLWLVDKLDDVGVSFDAEQLREILPYLQKWMRGK